MKRPLIVLLVGLILAVMSGIYLPLDGARPVHALNTACNVGTDNLDTVYQDWHASTAQLVPDSYPLGPASHWLNIDLWAYRISSRWGSPQGFDHCFRAYYGSVWTNDGTGGGMTGSIRTWDCGAGGFTFSHPATWASRNDAETDTPWGPNSHSAVVGTPDNENVTLYFADYGTWADGSLCLPQADTYAMRAASDTWTPPVLTSWPGGTWYCHDRNANFYCP